MNPVTENTESTHYKQMKQKCHEITEEVEWDLRLRYSEGCCQNIYDMGRVQPKHWISIAEVCEEKWNDFTEICGVWKMHIATQTVCLQTTDCRVIEV